MLDMRRAAESLATVVQGVRDDQLDAPTPCASRTLGTLLDHVDGLSLAFALAARKQEPEGGSRPPSADGAHLTPDWRSRIPTRLAAMAEAWRAPEAWTGVTRVGGVDLPGDVAALVALDELIVHGWDIAVSSGQPMETDPALVAAATSWVEASVARNPGGVPGLFGPPVSVTTSASPLEQLVALTGRDPGGDPEVTRAPRARGCGPPGSAPRVAERPGQPCEIPTVAA